MNEKIKVLMKNLDCTYEEALQIIEDDKAIDRKEKLFELTPEQKKNSKQARQVSRTPKPKNNSYTINSKSKDKKSKKTDEDKNEIMEKISEALKPIATDFTTNSERECVFFYNNRKFKLTIIAPRS